MAKKLQNNRATNYDGSVLVEQHTFMDDSILPPAEELQKLNAVDPNIIKWMMQRADVEQNARLKVNEENIALAKEDMQKSYRYDFFALGAVVLLILVTLGASVYLLAIGKDIAGSILVGVQVVAIVKLIFDSSKRKRK